MGRLSSNHQSKNIKNRSGKLDQGERQIPYYYEPAEKRIFYTEASQAV